MASSGPTRPNKRPADHLDSADPGPSTKAPKLFSIFTKSDDKQQCPDERTFRWLAPLGSEKTCLHGINLEPKASAKVAAFDLDGCLIESSIGKKKEKGKAAVPTFQWWRGGVPKKLREVLAEGFSIVIVTNQALRGSTAIKEWKAKIPLIGAALSDVPFRILAATARDGYRKPIPGMWYEVERIFAGEGVQIDKSASFFVGDAAGRKGDFSSTDRKWALNIGIPFLTPEEYFLKLKPAPYTLPGFHPSSLPTDVPHITPTSTPLLPTSSKPEIVLFVGYPALGKTTFYRKHFAPAGYVHVNQDTLKTREKCVKAVAESVQAGTSCVVDNTNRNAETRAYYVEVARKAGVPIRCFLFGGSIELAWHNNLYRAYNMLDDASSATHKRTLVPYNGFTLFKNSYQEPTLDEGFAEIKRVNWVFEGSKKELERWNMWLQIDGK